MNTYLIALAVGAVLGPFVAAFGQAENEGKLFTRRTWLGRLEHAIAGAILAVVVVFAFQYILPEILNDTREYDPAHGIGG